MKVYERKVFVRIAGAICTSLKGGNKLAVCRHQSHIHHISYLSFINETNICKKLAITKRFFAYRKCFSAYCSLFRTANRHNSLFIRMLGGGGGN
jgi:hypothetical protein